MLPKHSAACEWVDDARNGRSNAANFAFQLIHEDGYFDGSRDRISVVIFDGSIETFNQHAAGCLRR